MVECEEIQLAIVTLPPNEFKERPQFAKHVGNCEECARFIEDIRDIRDAAAPAWFLEHLPKNFWSEFAEEIKAHVYRFSRKDLYRYLRPPLYMAAGALLTMLLFLYPPHSKQALLKRFHWSDLFNTIHTLTDYGEQSSARYNLDPPTAADFLVTTYSQELQREGQLFQLLRRWKP